VAWRHRFPCRNAVAGRVSWPDGEFRASESVAVSGRSLARPEGTGDQGSRQVRIRQRVSPSRSRLDGTAFRTRCRAWRTTCPAIAYRRCWKVPARLVRHSGGSDSRIRTGRLQAMAVRYRHPALARNPLQGRCALPKSLRRPLCGSPRHRSPSTSPHGAG